MTTTGVTYNHKNGHFWQLDFTGKERDEETGYSYFGARYLDHTPLTLWLSVDPMADKYPSISPYAYCIWNSLNLNDPNGEIPIFFGLLHHQGKAKFGNSRVGETQMAGSFYVVPFYDDKENLLGYNAGRYRTNGNYVTEYQMGPEDLKMFLQNYSLYEAAANLVYCNGEPDWNSVAFASSFSYGDMKEALIYLGKTWSDAIKSPEYCLSIAFSIASIGTRIPNTSKPQPRVTKSAGSLQKNINEHQTKLNNYMSNPFSYDNKGILKDASYSRYRKIYNGRIKHLQHEIQTFKQEIEKIHGETGY